MDSLGNTLRKLRLDKEVPLRKVAAHLDIDQAILSKIERGHRKATREQVVKLAEYFQVEEEDLLVAWLSDKLVDEVANEGMALKALQVAEEKVAYKRNSNLDRQTTITRIRDFFKKDGRISKAWIFGSFARQENDMTSDIDLMIEVPQASSFSLFDLADIQYHLEKLLFKKVDVVMREGVHERVMKRILPDLKKVYER